MDRGVEPVLDPLLAAGQRVEAVSGVDRRMEPELPAVLAHAPQRVPVDPLLDDGGLAIVEIRLDPGDLRVEKEAAAHVTGGFEVTPEGKAVERISRRIANVPEPVAHHARERAVAPDHE